MMNLTKKILAVLALTCTTLPVIQKNTIRAEAKEYYPLGCAAYEVDTVNAKGGFDKVSCADTFEAAKTKMKTLGENGVVRHNGSYSPTKIIAMNSGMVFAYPFRSGSTLLNYYQDPGFSTSYAITYSGQHYQAAYFDTVSYSTNGTGSVHMNLNGFDGYVQLKDADLVPLRFFTDRLSITLGGNETYYSTPEQPYSIKPLINTYVCTQNGNYKDMMFTGYYGWPDDTGYSMSAGRNLALPAADWMNVGTTYYSYNGYDFYTDMGFHDYAGEYYNYYQFLPMRSKSKLTAADFDRFLRDRGVTSSSKLYGQGQVFLDAQNDYGVNALIVFAMACLESAYGTSNYAMNRNNFFGWGAVDTNPNEAAYYSSVRDGIRTQMAQNLAGYLDMDDWRYYGSMVGSKGAGFNLKYASAVYWGIQIASIAYRMDKVSCGYNGNLTDHDSVTIGIVKNGSASASLTKGGKTAYNILSCYGRYVPLYPVAVLSEEDGYYKTQCTNYVVNGKIYYIHSSADVRNYSWTDSVGWFSTKDIEIVNNVPAEPAFTAGEAVETLDTIAVDGTSVTLGGLCFREGIDETPAAVINITDDSFNDLLKRDPAVTAEGSGYRWTCSMDLRNLEEGVYYFRNDYTYQKASQYGGSYYLKTDTVPDAFVRQGRSYTFARGSDSSLSLRIAAVTCAEGTHYDEEAGGCAADIVRTVEKEEEIQPDDQSVMRGVDEVTYSAETGTVTLKGLAFFPALDAAAGTVSHELILVNPEKGTETILPAVTDNYGGLLKTASNNLSDVGFTAELNLSEIETGNYYLRIRVNNPEKTAEGALFCNIENIDSAFVNEKGETVRFFANPLSNYRLEVSAEKQSLDLDDVKKPSRMTSLFGYNSMSIEDGILAMDGIGIIYGAAMSEKDEVRYALYAEDEEGNVKVFEAAATDSGMDYAAFLGGSKPLTMVTFNLNRDLSELAAGTYRLYLEITTKDWHDLFEIYSISDDRPEPAEKDGRVYSIGTTDVRSRYVLNIAGKDE